MVLLYPYVKEIIMIEIKNLFKKYIREYFALYDINLQVKKGETVALVGEKDSGKTTLLRILAKLEKFDKGEIYINDVSLKKIDFVHDISLGYVSFKPVFFENKTVYQNFVYVLKQRKLKAFDYERIINSVLIDYNIEKYKDVLIKDLSLFEKYLVSLVRLMLRNLDVVLIDNIFDDLTEEQLQVLLTNIKAMFADKKVTMLIAVENGDTVKGICKRFVKFKSGSIVE